MEKTDQSSRPDWPRTVPSMVRFDETWGIGEILVKYLARNQWKLAVEQVEASINQFLLNNLSMLSQIRSGGQTKLIMMFKKNH